MGEVKARDSYFDLLKGLAILGVVSIHLLGSTSVFCGEHYYGVTLGLLRQVVCCSVPVFMFLAGYFSDGGNLYRRVRRLLVPYLIWTVIQVVVFKPHDLCDPVRFVVRDCLFGYGIGIGYFVVALLQLSLISPLLKRMLLAHPRWTFFCAVILNLGGLGVYYLLAVGGTSAWGMGVPAPIPGIFFPIWIVPYTMGLYFHLCVNQFMGGMKNVIALVTISFLAMIAEAAYWNDGFIEVSQLRVASFIFSICLCMAFMRNHLTISGRNVLAVLGRGSFFIYFTHMNSFILFYELKKFGCWFDHMSLVAYLVDMAVIVLLYWGVIFLSERKLPVSIRKIIGVS